MKKIAAFEATDGTKFFTEHECLNHEKLREFENWHTEHRIRSHGRDEPQTQHLHNWILKNAEDIRGFLPPVVQPAVPPELDIEVLRGYTVALHYGCDPSVVHICDVQKWLAGELK